VNQLIYGLRLVVAVPVLYTGFLIDDWGHALIRIGRGLEEISEKIEGEQPA
jgi:hypothetical protein